MANNSSSIPGDITQDHGSTVEIIVLALTAFSVFATLVFLVTRLCCKYVVPGAWRLSLILQDVSNLLLGFGLLLFLAYMGTSARGLCSAAGFFTLLGLLDSACVLGFTAISLLFLQNPGKLGQLSTFRKSWIVVFVVPEKLVVFLLALMPVTPISYFDTVSPYPVACFPVRQEGGKGAAFGAILFFILWVLEILGIILSVVCAFRLWKSNNSRIHASSPNLWQMEKIGQGRALQKMLLLEQLCLLVATFTLTVVLYTYSGESRTPQWVVMVTVAVVTVLHACLCGVQLVLWSSACCCQGNQNSKEPHQRLKKLELMKVEGPGKLRLKASWSAGKGVTRRGLVKVYGLNQLKGWAQEIVVLGMLRKCQNASLLQCLWTANTNPYFETMTMLSGQIVTSEARLICLELTSSGNLQDFLARLDVPLPEPCTRTILHDLAEGLASLHSQNILHRNLTSAAVYLKGSVQRLVLRAALGDFEEAQIYGSLQNGTITSSVSKKHFFLPDIRAFALVALEILGFVCKRRQEEKQPHRLVTSPRARPALGLAEGKGHDQEGRGEDGRKPRKISPASNTQFCAPGAADDFAEKDGRVGGRIFVVGTTAVGDAGPGELREKKRRRGDDGGVRDRVLPPPSPFENEYMEMGEFEDGDSGNTSMRGYYPDHPEQMDVDAEEADPRLPPITHVREAYSYEFPNQSVFKAQSARDEEGDNDYEEIDDIEEEIHREIRYNALHRRREAARTGGYIVTRTTSGRELFIPANQHNASFGNSDSGYMGTSSNSSRYPMTAGDPGAGGVDDPPDLTWPKAAHRTTSANTISSFGDDILEVLPGMTDEDDMKKGERSLRQMLRAREEAKVEQILEEYKERVRTGAFSNPLQDWPKLKFSRAMGHHKAVVGGEDNRSRPSTPRAVQQVQQEDAASPRPKTAVGSSGQTRAVKRIDKARPLSASTSSVGAWKLRNSFKKNKARSELARALSRGNSFAQVGEREQRGAGGKLVEQKYAAHNAAFRHDEAVDTEMAQAGAEGQYLEPEAGRSETPRRNHEPTSESLRKDVSYAHSKGHDQQRQQQQQQQRLQQQQQQQQQQQDYGHTAQKPSGAVNVGKFSSFSSNDSFVSYGQPQHVRDTSLTSGELTSLSSQADTARGRDSRQDRPAEAPEQRRDSKGDGAADSKAAVVIPGMKLVDSGFDEDSASVVSDVSCEDAAAAAVADSVSPNVSGEACTCSCLSETVTASQTCSCDCSQCRYSHSGGSPRHSGWSESQSSCGTWSNSNSFSSYDVQMHRRKLPSKPKGSEEMEEHVLGPDEQYPVHPPASSSAKPQPQPASPTRLSPPSRQSNRPHRHHHHHHRNHHAHGSHDHSGGGRGAGGGSTSSKESSSAASRRYRELTQKGVPLRVSVVDDSDGQPRAERRHAGGKPWASFNGQEGATAEVIEEEEDGSDNALYQDLESQGFFESTDSASSKSSPARHRRRSGVAKRLEMVQGGHAGGGGGVAYNRFTDLPPIPSLEDIIREIPDETGDSCSGDETKAFLNRPESELSVKALKPPAPKPPTDRPPYGKDGGIPIADLHREPKVVHDAELVIDRIFSRAHPANTKGSESFVDPTLGLDEAAIRELAMLPPPAADLRSDPGRSGNGSGDGDGGPGEAQVPLLRGTDWKHVRYVRCLSDKLDLLAAKELLPADPRSFDILRRRLQHSGSFGTISLQLLDIIGDCWVKETPPSTADIVDQLTDHVTETAL